MTSIAAKTVRGWYRVHKWASLACTFFLLISCVTGLPLIFHDELDSLFGHEVRPANLPSNTPNASLDRMVLEAKQTMPSLQPYAIGFDDDEPRVFVTMTPTPKPEGFRTVFFDQHTGKLLETGTPGKDLLSQVLALHRELFIGLPGYLFMGLMAVFFVISLVSGVLVYGPFMRRLNFGTYRRDGAPRVRWFDLHNLVGIVTFAWMVVVGATGIMNALSTPLFGLWRIQTLPALLAPYHGQPAPDHYGSIDQAVSEAASTLPTMRVTSVLFPNGVISSPRHYIVWTRGKTPVTAKLFTPVLIDAESEKVTMAKGLPWYLRTLEISRPLHFGDYGGLPLKFIWAVFDIGAIAVLVSGLVLWRTKKNGFQRWLEEAASLEQNGASA